MKRCMICGLCVLLVVCLCACGGPKAAKPKDYGYTVTQEDNGTYTIRVAGDDGDLYLRQRMASEPECLALTKDVLQIVGDSGNGHRWAVFCDVANEKVSDAIGNYVAANDTKVAYVDYLTDAYQLFVRDIFDESAYLEATTLSGLVVQEDGTLIKNVRVKNNQLMVTYQTAAGDATVTMAMPE